MWKQFRLLQATCKRTYLSSKNITRSLWPRVVARWTGDQPSRFVLLMSAPNSTNSFAESILPSRMHWCNAVSPASFNALIFKPLLSSRWTSSRSFLFTASWKALCFSLVSIKDAFVRFCLYRKIRNGRLKVWTSKGAGLSTRKYPEIKERLSFKIKYIHLEHSHK